MTFVTEYRMNITIPAVMAGITALPSIVMEYSSVALAISSRIPCASSSERKPARQ